jgi:predicted amidophosphoribosyltransferase
VKPVCSRCDRCRDRTARFAEKPCTSQSAWSADKADCEEAVPRETRCQLCQRVDPPFERAVAYGSYDSELRDLIHLLKFQQVRPAAAVLGRMLAETIANLEPKMPTSGKIVVVPVPLHASARQAQRGFNQAEMIARGALKQLSRPKRI